MFRQYRWLFPVKMECHTVRQVFWYRIDHTHLSNRCRCCRLRNILHIVRHCCERPNINSVSLIYTAESHHSHFVAAVCIAWAIVLAESTAITYSTVLVVAREASAALTEVCDTQTIVSLRQQSCFQVMLLTDTIRISAAVRTVAAADLLAVLRSA